MLSKILSKEQCAQCKFCCSFRRQSLWESPFVPSCNYKTQDPSEEIPCDYLDKKQGCTLSQEKKPFDCKIWPFRVMEDTDGIFITMATTCPALNNTPEETIVSFLSELKPIIQKNVENGNCSIKKMSPLYKKYSHLY
ncbi:MAG: hypothetical protein SPI86_00170 [Treponemataceae bacterium]|nr:hypothetical protein [Spirochaetales bacterium]MDY6030155.1 hypothetical protein [Treponemataceae bacterium]